MRVSGELKASDLQELLRAGLKSGFQNPGV